MRKFYIAEECVNAVKEVTNYHKNDKGQIATNQPDHLVDIMRYFFHESGWSSSRGIVQSLQGEGREFTTPEEDFYKTKTEEEQAFEPSHLNEVEELELDDSLWN